MKKILFAAFAATLLAAGCQKTEVIAPTTGSPITFSTEMKKITKADETLSDGDQNLQNQGFNIWAYADFSAEDLANSTNVDKTSADDHHFIYDGMYNLHVSYENDAWDPGREYYWPGQNKDLKFFAVSAPLAANNTLPFNVEIESGIENNTTASMEITGFSVPNGDPNVTEGAKGPNLDLMVADIRKQNQAQNGKVVALNFRHTLSKVEFVFTTNESPYKEGTTTNELKENATKVFVQKIEVKGLYDTGTLTVSPSSASASSETITDNAEVTAVSSAWTDLSNSSANTTGTFSAIYKKADSNFPSKYQDISGVEHLTAGNDSKALLLTTTPEPFATWLMIPQSIKVDAADDTEAIDKIVEITYVINNRQFVSKFSLGGAKSATGYQVPSWDVNQYVKYTINLSPNLITFEAESNDWTPTTNVEHQN